MRFGERQQVAIRHVEGLVLFVGESAGMPPLPYGHLLDPADGIEAPTLQIRSHRLLDPFERAPVVLLLPKMNVLRITHRCRVDVVDAEREERLPVWRDEPPVILPSTESKESLRLALRGLRRRPQAPGRTATPPRPRQRRVRSPRSVVDCWNVSWPSLRHRFLKQLHMIVHQSFRVP